MGRILGSAAAAAAALARGWGAAQRGRAVLCSLCQAAGPLGRRRPGSAKWRPICRCRRRTCSQVHAFL